MAAAKTRKVMKWKIAAAKARKVKNNAKTRKSKENCSRENKKSEKKKNKLKLQSRKQWLLGGCNDRILFFSFSWLQFIVHIPKTQATRHAKMHVVVGMLFGLF